MADRDLLREWMRGCFVEAPLLWQKLQQHGGQAGGRGRGGQQTGLEMPAGAAAAGPASSCRVVGEEWGPQMVSDTCVGAWCWLHSVILHF